MVAYTSFFLAILATVLANKPNEPSTNCNCWYDELKCPNTDIPCVEVDCFEIDTQEKAECAIQVFANMTATVNQSSFYKLNFQKDNLDLFPDNLLDSMPVIQFDITLSYMSSFPHRLINPVCSTLRQFTANYIVGFDRIEGDGFVNCPLLYDIMVQNSNIVDVSPRAFVGVDNLLQLTIRWNPRLPSFHGVEGVQQLNTLRLDYNRMDTLDKNAFLGLPKVVDIYLGYNYLTTIEEGTFDPINKTLTHIHLEGNPFYCDCSLAWLKEWISGDIFYDNVTCDGPIKGLLKTMDYLDDCETKYKKIK